MKRVPLTLLTGLHDQRRATIAELDKTLSALEADLLATNESLAQIIASRSLYFRVSIIGACNLACPFCHNEGGPETGRMPLDVFSKAAAAARQVGFTRIQLTGGEPLLNPAVLEYVSGAKVHFEDVGVTTNGTYLPKYIDDLLSLGTTRIHVSLQRETLEETTSGAWQMPDWLADVVNACNGAGTVIRFNLPVAPDSVELARNFLMGADALFAVNIFALLGPQDDQGDGTGYLDALKNLAAEVSSSSSPVTASVRDYLQPSGRRCNGCSHRSACTEQSRSLRLGVDSLLRPCLASRYWDLPFDPTAPYASTRRATLLALDYLALSTGSRS